VAQVTSVPLPGSLPGAVEAYGFNTGNTYTALAWARPTAGMTAAQAEAPIAAVAVWPSFTAYDLYGSTLTRDSVDAEGRDVYNLTSSPVFFRKSAGLQSRLIPVTPRVSGP